MNDPQKFLWPNTLRTLGVLGITAVAAEIYEILPQAIDRHYKGFLPTSLRRTMFDFREIVLEAAVFCAVLLLAAPFRRMAPRWRETRLTIPALTLTSIGIAWFILHFGNRQFGAWDYSILIDTGWRQFIGQRPYVDFITPNPPAFNLGVLWAFQVFGVTWNAQLYAIAIFSVATFLWMYWLLRKLSAERYAAILISLSIECAAVIPVCFWWYNDITAVTAAVFFLSTTLCILQDKMEAASLDKNLAWVSYAVSFGMLALMKPNIAGFMLVPSVILLVIAAQMRSKAVIWTLAGTVLAISLLLLNHVSILGMLSCYRSAAIGRGLSVAGLYLFTPRAQVRLMAWTLTLSAPLGVVAIRCGRAFLRKLWHEVGFLLLLLLPLPVTVYGMCTNGEVKDSETSVLIATCGLVALVLRWTPMWLRTVFLAMLFSIIGANIWYGAERVRVFGIGDGSFFQLEGADTRIHDKLFSELTSTQLLLQVQQEIRRAVALYAGPVFLGPRLEFEYANLSLPSPPHWPVYYQPGTAFSVSDVARLTDVWHNQHFHTLIFLGNDRIFYPEELTRIIDTEYVMEPGYEAIQVFRRRQDLP